jgi:ATP-dependent DNA ligase
MSASASKRPEAIADLAVGPDTHPMEARSVEKLPAGEGWQFEPKWDGFRCLAFKAGQEVELRAKSGKPLGRYFPEVVQALRDLPPASFVLDGELAIPQGGHALLRRAAASLHPAESRSASSPARRRLGSSCSTFC